ncbi:MAG: hypothetical protein P0Y60_04420 [Candidatus Microbacterium colombiense]|nr:MAG: hypothetical protein P0Y60_04420 [Microbacterium sp.]
MDHSDEEAQVKPQTTMIRTQVAVDDVGFFLAQGQDVSDIKKRIEFAAQAGGRFVDFVVLGNRTVSVLMSAASHVVISTESVEFDARDNGDEGVPFGGVFDML